MTQIGRKIYYDIATGNPIATVGEMVGYVRATTIEEDMAIYTELQGRIRESFNVLELPFGAYADKFATCTGYRVNPDRKVIDFIFDGTKADDLASLKAIKVANLKRLCEETIEAGFVSKNGHHYRTNRDDQINFIDTRAEILDNPSITSVLWKTEDAGYLNHSREDWLSICQEGREHKKKQLYKYDQLKSRVLSDETDTQAKVDGINW